MSTIEALSRLVGRLLLATCLPATPPTLVFAKVDAHVGTWDLNLEKSTFNPGPPPGSRSCPTRDDRKY